MSNYAGINTGFTLSSHISSEQTENKPITNTLQSRKAKNITRRKPIRPSQAIPSNS